MALTIAAFVTGIYFAALSRTRLTHSEKLDPESLAACLYAVNFSGVTLTLGIVTEAGLFEIEPIGLPRFFLVSSFITKHSNLFSL